MDQIIIGALTYLGGVALKKWPDFKDEYIPRALWVIAIAQTVLTNIAGIGTTPTVAPAYEAMFASAGVPIQFAGPMGGDVAAIAVGTKIWLGTQVYHLVEKVLLKGLFKIKIPW